MKNSTLIRNSCWESIRDLFSESEKEKLRFAKCGEAICPSGIIIDPDKIDPVLEFKLDQAISEWKAGLP